MLKLTMCADDYLTINDNIVVHLTRATGNHADVAIHAPREVPILRGTVLERLGGQRPACLNPPVKRKNRYYRDKYFRWNDDREQAVRAMQQIMDRLERSGAAEESAALRKQLELIIPPFWEDEAAEGTGGE